MLSLRFVVAGPSETFHVITASHRLPYLPPAHPASPLEERTYANLLGHLGESLLFGQSVFLLILLLKLRYSANQHDYKPIMIKTFDGEMIEAKDHNESLTTQAWLLSLDGNCFECEVEHRPDGPLRISKANELIVGGMSGSPILSKAGATIGVACTSVNDGLEGGPNPRLMANLPGWT